MFLLVSTLSPIDSWYSIHGNSINDEAGESVFQWSAACFFLLMTGTGDVYESHGRPVGTKGYFRTKSFPQKLWSTRGFLAARIDSFKGKAATLQVWKRWVVSGWYWKKNGWKEKLKYILYIYIIMINYIRYYICRKMVLVGDFFYIGLLCYLLGSSREKIVAKQPSFTQPTYPVLLGVVEIHLSGKSRYKVLEVTLNHVKFPLQSLQKPIDFIGI